MKYDTLLFDADDTVLDFKRSEEVALEETLRHFGAPFSSEIKEKYRNINEGLWRQFERQEISKEALLKSRFAMLFDAISLKLNSDEVNSYYLDALSQGAYLIEGALEVCAELSKRTRLYIVTNGVTMTQKKRLLKSGLMQYFSDVFVSEEIGYQKPHDEYFDHVFSKIGADKSRTLIIGDSLSSDMRGGANAGISRCWFCQSEAVPDVADAYDYRISRLEQLFDIVE